MALRCLILLLSFNVLAGLCFGYPSNSHPLPATIPKDIDNSHSEVHARDAFTSSLRHKNNEGEAHDRIRPPSGSELASIRIRKGHKEEVAVFRTKDVRNDELAHAYVMIHGKLRNGGRYWEVLNDVVKDARKDGFPGADRNLTIIAPQFFSTRYNSHQYTENQLAWGDLNAWQAGEPATHPVGTKITSMDALDAIIEDFSDQSSYPKLKNITVVGHGGGGQLAQRYAAVAEKSAPHLHIRYIHGDGSSCAYFTSDRPILQSAHGGGLPSKDECKLYNTWRYGFDGFPGTAEGHLSRKEYFKRYINRDVISLVGYQDINQHGDQTCMGRMQGGRKRRTRNLIWYRYINTLARTDENLDGFPGSFDPLPDWSDISDNKVKLRLIVVEGASHNPAELFKHNSGRSALFSDGDVAIGWRPTA